MGFSGTSKKLKYLFPINFTGYHVAPLSCVVGNTCIRKKTKTLRISSGLERYGISAIGKMEIGI